MDLVSVGGVWAWTRWRSARHRHGPNGGGRGGGAGVRVAGEMIVARV
jgi:hypothetical protein